MTLHAFIRTEVKKYRTQALRIGYEHQTLLVLSQFQKIPFSDTLQLHMEMN